MYTHTDTKHAFHDFPPNVELSCPHSPAWSPDSPPEGLFSLLGGLDDLLDACIEGNAPHQQEMDSLLLRLAPRQIMFRFRHESAPASPLMEHLQGLHEKRNESTRDWTSREHARRVALDALKDALPSDALVCAQFLREHAIENFCPVHIRVLAHWARDYPLRHTLGRSRFALAMYLRLIDVLVAPEIKGLPRLCTYSPERLLGPRGKGLTEQAQAILEKEFRAAWLPDLARKLIARFDVDAETVMLELLNSSNMIVDFECDGELGTPPLFCPRLDRDDVAYHVVQAEGSPLPVETIRKRGRELVLERNLISVSARDRKTFTSRGGSLRRSFLKDSRLFVFSSDSFGTREQLFQEVEEIKREQAIVFCVGVASVSDERTIDALQVQRDPVFPCSRMIPNGYLLASLLETDPAQRFVRDSRGQFRFVLMSIRSSARPDKKGDRVRALQKRLADLHARQRKLQQVIAERVEDDGIPRDLVPELEAWAHASRVTLDEAFKRLRVPVGELKRDGFDPGIDPLAAYAEKQRTTPSNPYRELKNKVSKYRAIFDCLVALESPTREELIDAAMARLKLSPDKRKSIDYAVSVVISPKPDGEPNPMGHRSAKGETYYVTKDANARYQLHWREAKA